MSEREFKIEDATVEDMSRLDCSSVQPEDMQGFASEENEAQVAEESS